MEDILDKVIDLLETLAKDSEKNGNGDGAYYYRSAIPYINAIKKGERNYDNQIKIRQK